MSREPGEQEGSEGPLEPERTHRPRPGAKIEATGFQLGLLFNPEISLVKKKGLRFAGDLSDYMSLEKTEFESHKWTFVEPLAGEPAGQFLIMIEPGSLRMLIFNPQQRQEWVEERFRKVLKKF